MEPERTAPGSSADLGLAAGTAAATASHKHGSTMQDVLSEIQSLVERSNIINVSISTVFFNQIGAACCTSLTVTVGVLKKCSFIVQCS